METCKTSLTVVIVDTGEHLFKVVGHSRVVNNANLTSETFHVGGHDWANLYYPNGDTSIVDGLLTSVFVQLVSTIVSDVTAYFSFCLLNHVIQIYIRVVLYLDTYSSVIPRVGFFHIYINT